ncbi:IclR family transcriptional regulator [Variovorax sp. PBS-H4]|uniref:IclR family transcriptional regulator n=1 Tax=Variovorax sp. PBS-H4 TaxID=434008 RepID=UPI0013A55A8B|nr:IclR family transcriptional regulator [Variovorax sp. PBS-H4]
MRPKARGAPRRDAHNAGMRRNISASSAGAPQVSPDTGTVSRVALLLRLAAEQREAFTLKDIASAAGLPVPTVHRLLDLLAREGLIAPEGGRRGYRIGTELYRIGSLVKVNTPIPRLINGILSSAVAEVDETCHFAQYLPAQLAVMFDSSVDSSHPLDFRWEVHKPLSLVWGASGRTILAYLPEEKVDQALAAELTWSPTRTPPTRKELLEALAEIRRLGYAFTRGQRVPGAMSILAPVFDENNLIYGALGFVIPEPRFDPARMNVLAQTAKKYAGQLSAALGAPR